ncbi:unnamed protein product [Rotaria magnacalcarata]|uniref:ceramidase n=2 Tax=Rotaria magnacalcarata TaxID=392030 RepID=A0A816TWE9_9BILA|nr:unnamed protein product [Rotaria magnacalcarata]CAF1463169.1 unnamed protein product [Rotaria magnacalcarata]CAF2011901.1 unnamed protein product [Rotaria magnacalcarata]CAF2101646.1 unnamed protein product [Rotaria magnacalcarata]CAF2112792.1 unnamed protein product [Rotaria magnacalcarata]
MANYRKLKVYEVGTDTYIDYEANFQRVPCACAFHPNNDLCAISYDNGNIRIYSTYNDNLKLVKELSCHSQCIFAIAWISDKLLCATSGDQTTVIYDIETGDEIDLLRGHTMSVRSVCKLYYSTNVLATGGRDSIINIYDRRYSKKQGALHPISSIACAHISSTALQKSARKDTRSVTAVEFQDEHNLYSCACADSAIKVWDLRYTYSRLNTNHTPKPKRMLCVPNDDVKSINRLAGFSDMKMDSNRMVVFANCTNSKIYQFDLREDAYASSSKIQSYAGHRVGSFNIKIALSPHDQLLLTGSSDFYAYIYRVNQPQIEPMKVEHNFEEVTAIAYHPTNPFSFITCSDDFQVRLWSLSLDNEISTLPSSLPNAYSVNNQSHNIATLLRQRQYGLTNRKTILSSVFHTAYSPTRLSSCTSKRKYSLADKTIYNSSRKRTVSENDENRRDNTNEQTSKRLCRSSEWIFGDSQLTLFKSISTIDNRTSIIDEQQANYLLSKSDGFLSNSNNNNRRYSSDKQQTLDTLATLVLSQYQFIFHSKMSTFDANKINVSPFRLGSSDVDWCEPNYVVSEYIAEFWNTVSNIFFFLVPPFSIILFSSYSRRIANGITVLWLLLIVIGIGSIYFHATLSLAGQLIDEICILWVLMAGYALFLPAIYLPQSLRVPRHQFIYSCIMITVAITCLAVVYPYANSFALMILGLPAIAFMILHLSRCDNRRIKNLGIHCIGMWVVAVTVWLSDRIFCPFWISISFPYLHSIWHALILFSSNEAIVVCAYLIVKHQYPQANLVLHAWPNENWGWFTLPYLQFHDDTNYLSSSSPANNLITKSIV